MRYEAYLKNGRKVRTAYPAVRYTLSSDFLCLYNVSAAVVAVIPILELGLLETRED